MHDAHGNFTMGTNAMANHLGLSPQGLRWYEKQGLISPAKETGRRRFTPTDLCTLSGLRQYQHIGIPLNEAHELITSTPSCIINFTEQHIMRRRRELAIQRIELDATEERCDLIADYICDGVKIRDVKFGPLLFKEGTDVGSLFLEKPASSFDTAFSEWSDLPPCAFYLNIRDYRSSNIDPILGMLESSQPGVNSKLGVALEPKYLSFADEAVRKDATRGGALTLEAVDAIYVLFVRPADNPNTLVKLLREHAHGRKLSSTVYLKPVACFREDHANKTLWEAWIPLEKSKGREDATCTGIVTIDENWAHEIGLTHREYEILSNRLSGLSVARIAENLYISPSTIKTHIRNAYRKLAVSSLKEAREVARLVPSQH